MKFIVYALAVVSIILAIGGLAAYSKTKQIGLLISSIVSISFSVAAITIAEWWPLLVGFTINWILRLAGLDPTHRK